MSRILLTVFLMFTTAIFWYNFSSRYVGFVYNSKTQSKEFLLRNYSGLLLLEFDSSRKIDEAFDLFSSKGVKIIIGPPTSAEGEKLLPFLKKYKMVALSATISSTRLLNSSYIYSFTPSNAFITEKIKELLSKIGTKRLILLSDPQNKQYSDEFVDLLKTFEGKNVYYYNEDTLKSIDVQTYDTVVMTLLAKEAAKAVKVLKSMNPSIKIVGTDSVMSVDFLSYAGNIVEDTYLVYTMDYLENPELGLIGEVSSFLSKHRFLSIDQFRRYLERNVIETDIGIYHYENRSISRPIRIFQVVNGQFKEVENF
uniref:Amino acid ABC transporter substrate-binding protein n=1 Tax=Fervidobacterium nodosum TaxID=2424 RepID=A0A7C5U7A2_9BACT